jgi:2',3'-cyclic-nucleotide 2'-phosphodiesterase/3'-nucleotidase
MQPRNWATSVAIAHLTAQRQNGRWRVLSKKSSIVQAVHHKEHVEVLGVTEEGHRAAERYARTAVGSTAVSWRADSARVIDSPLTDFILEVERSATGAQLASTAMFSLDANLAAGPVTVARIAALYPYDNTLRVVKITGAQLRAYLEQSARYFRSTAAGAEVDPSIPGFNYDMLAGVDYTIDVSKPIGERITQLDYRGRAVVPTDTFTLALNNYRQTGGGGYSMLRGAPVVQDRQLEIRQLLIDEVRRRGTLTPADYFHANWRIVPSTAIAGLLKTQK